MYKSKRNLSKKFVFDPFQFEAIITKWLPENHKNELSIILKLIALEKKKTTTDLLTQQIDGHIGRGFGFWEIAGSTCYRRVLMNA